VFNFALYWYSDRIAIAMTRSKPVTEQEYPRLYAIVRDLTAMHQMPMPRIYVSEMLQPNAFATGRNPEHAAVWVTRGSCRSSTNASCAACWLTSSRSGQPRHPDPLDRGRHWHEHHVPGHCCVG